MLGASLALAQAVGDRPVLPYVVTEDATQFEPVLVVCGRPLQLTAVCSCLYGT